MTKEHTDFIQSIKTARKQLQNARIKKDDSAIAKAEGALQKLKSEASPEEIAALGKNDSLRAGLLAFVVLAILLLCGITCLTSGGNDNKEPETYEVNAVEMAEYGLESDPEPEIVPEPEIIPEPVVVEPEEEVSDATPDGFTQASVSRVIDGDTIVLTSGERVRFIGIDAPEVGEPGGSEATAFVRDLIDGQIIWLESDGDDTDRFDRLRRYVWIEMPTDPRNEQQIREYMLNAMLLEAGLAEVMIVGSPKNATLFRNIVQPPTFSSAPTQETGEVLVWLSATGSSWHDIDNCGRMNPARATQITLEEARNRANLSPCGRCNPPQ